MRHRKLRAHHAQQVRIQAEKEKKTRKNGAMRRRGKGRPAGLQLLPSTGHSHWTLP